MPNPRLILIALWLLIGALAIFLLERLLVLVGVLSSTLLLFAVSWLVALILQPLVDRLQRMSMPRAAPRGNAPEGTAAALAPQMPRVVAVSLVFAAFLCVVLVFILSLIPTISVQLTNLVNGLPKSPEDITAYVASAQLFLTRLNIRTDLTQFVDPVAVAQQVAPIGTTALQQGVGIAGSIASLLFNTFIVLILSFYITLDGPTLTQRFQVALPAFWHREAELFFSTVDRVFGGFMRAQLLNSVVYGIVTVVVMAAFGLTDLALAGVICGVLVLIPLVGGFIALVPPVLIAIGQNPGVAIPLLLVLFGIQQVLFNVLMPRFLGQIIGLHPLLVFFSLLAGGVIGGGWGILLGIPIAGVAASISQFLYFRANHPDALEVVMVAAAADAAASDLTPTDVIPTATPPPTADEAI